MGRQIHLHTYGEDTRGLVRFVRSHCDLIVTLRYSPNSEIESIHDPASENQGMTLWNRDLLPNLSRERIQLNDGGERFYIEYSHPVLEFSPSNVTTWNSRPALLQGRIYGSDFLDRPTYSSWYDSIRRWVAKEFQRNPFGTGYVGPEAWRWFQKDGLLLPQINPPVIPVWQTEFAKQDALRQRNIPTQHLND